MHRLPTVSAAWYTKPRRFWVMIWSRSSTWARISSNVMATPPLVQNGYVALLDVPLHTPYDRRMIDGRDVFVHRRELRSLHDKGYLDRLGRYRIGSRLRNFGTSGNWLAHLSHLISGVEDP